MWPRKRITFRSSELQVRTYIERVFYEGSKYRTNIERMVITSSIGYRSWNVSSECSTSHYLQFCSQFCSKRFSGPFNWRYDWSDGDEFTWLFIPDRQQGEGGLFTRRRDHRDAPPLGDEYLNAAAAYVFGHGENDEEGGDDYDRRIVNPRRTSIL